MKTKIYSKYITFLMIIMSVIIVFLSPNKTPQNSFAIAGNTISSEIVIDVYSGRILYQKNKDEKMFMASTTKILTAICIIENCNLDDVVMVKKETTGIEGSSIYLVEGEKLTVKELLYGLMLRSGNDCAETLAVFCSGSISDFAILMNETAKKIGAYNSNFVNPHGLHDDNHYTTAYDLGLISAHAMKNSAFREIVGTKKVKISNTKAEYDRILVNKNKMLKEFEGSTGIKTGYTKKAGRCLVSSCIRENREFICVVLNCPPMFERSKNLFNESFDKYTNIKLVEADNIIGFINDKSNKKFALSINKDIILPLTKEEYCDVDIVYDYNTNINEELISGEKIGEIKIYCKNNLIFTEKIYTI